MNSLIIVFISFFLFALGYRFYSKYISIKIFNLNDKNITPAHKQRDELDFVPSKKHILFGHHFTSIAGAAPIIGPCIAVYWGWLPAILWIVMGTVFMGAVHDFGALVLSLKEKGRSIADISSNVINKRVRVMFLIFVMSLTWLVLAVFANAISILFSKFPTSVLPINIEILIAIIMGYIIYKKNINSFFPSLAALIILYIFVWIGSTNPIKLESFGIVNENVQHSWIIILFFYSAIASLLPVWILLQPRDYINSHQLIVGLILIFSSIIIIQPEVIAPALTNIDSGPPIIPFLFVTIACGAISGFHGLVSSGTTSKQINHMTDSRMIGYGATLGEGTLAIAATIAAIAGLSFVTTECYPWSCNFAAAKQGALPTFINGSSALLEKIGLSVHIAQTLIVVLVVSFAATTLDSATRIQRYIITEFGEAINFNLIKNKFIATLISIIPAYLIASNDNLRNDLWTTFGSSNQMLASLTLMVLSIYLFKKKKNILPFAIPMLIVMLITFSALTIKLNSSPNTFILIINSVLIFLFLWMIVEGFIHCAKVINKRK